MNRGETHHERGRGIREEGDEPNPASATNWFLSRRSGLAEEAARAHLATTTFFTTKAKTAEQQHDQNRPHWLGKVCGGGYGL
ncbi:unnamed protein product [Nippostrongylus brasiliensis]|uniref:Uncharacterized protein n=1 Tax=Nippostrongylus brasiliensis TaxID=27835 RepID=A0A0N4YJ08_NIPBR|nr:unnamed protein product [Nippostrongylus brasiliensis]